MKKYKSKISYGMLIGIFLLFFTPIIIGTLKNGFSEKSIIGLGILTITYAFILDLFLRTEYSIENNKLKIKCSFFYRKEIDISKITHISKTNNIISSPAPSFDRIEIKYGKFGQVIISPKNKVSFAKELTELNPNIENKILE